jgi:cytochrome P450
MNEHVNDQAGEPPEFPFPRGPLSAPPTQYAGRRAGCPMGSVRLPSGDEALLLVRYRDVHAAMEDPRLSRDLLAPGAPRMTSSATVRQDPNIITNKNGPDHLRIRRIVAAAFSPRRVESWKPIVRAVATELLDALEQAGPPVDLVADYCVQLPVRIICRLLGVPAQDLTQFQAWTGAIVFDARMDPERRQREITAFAEYVKTLIAERRAAPGTDLIDDLIAARDGEDRLSEVELLYLTMALIVAGNESTFNTLSRSVLTLLTGDRARWEELAARPELIPAATEELMRLNVLGTGALRYATEDVELPSGTIKSGQAVVIEVSSAARDETVFPDPDSVRFDREDPAPLPIFGSGAHYCLGAHLAKAELHIGLGMLIERLPKLRLAVDPDEVRFSDGELINSLLSLPVDW